MLKQKQLMVAAVVVILLILGLGGFFLFSKQSPSTQNQTSNATTGDKKSAMGSIVDLIKGGSNVMCNFNTTDDENGYTNTGTIYISSGNMRGDFVTTKEGKATNMSMIRNGNDNYIWGDEMETGIKMTISTEDLTEETNENSKYVDLNQKLDYKCNPWGVDQSKFTPPSNIKFTDLSKMMEETTKMIDDKDGEIDSSICDSIEDANAKTACKNAMSQ